MDALLKLKRNKGATKKSQRIGRGNGSGRGSYSGRGGNGQTARTGGGTKPGFIGGQTPIYRKMPKFRGFTNINRVVFQAVNLKDLNVFDENETVDKEKLYAKHLIRNASEPVKLLGTGELTKKLNIQIDRVSDSAKKKLEKSKSTVTEMMSADSETPKATKAPAEKSAK